LNFSERQFKKTKLALALMVAMHSNCSLAQIAPQEIKHENSAQDSPNDESSSITWPLLSGESVESLAVLFYPKNKKMQRLFISKTLQLSRELQPNLNAYVISKQASLIVIPNIKILAKHSGKIKPAPLKIDDAKIANHGKPPTLQMSYSLKDAEKYTPTPEMQAHYEDLVKRNALLKLELEKLNNKLAHLQQVMAALNVEARRAQASTKPVTIDLVEPADKKPNKLKQFGHTHNNKILHTTNHTQTSLLPRYWVAATAALIMALTAFLGLRFYNRRKSNNTRQFESDAFKAMATIDFVSPSNSSGHVTVPFNKVDFSLTASEHTGSISDGDLDAIMSLHTKDESLLVLEQARIYVNINREKEAIVLLQSQIQSAPKMSLDHWLYLLEIYKNTNQKEEFLQYANLLHENFNVMTPQWESSAPAIVTASSLEEFPHIVEHLAKLCANSENTITNEAELKTYLNDLLTDNRDNERLGFSLEVLQEIMLIRNLLDVREKLAAED
jgi:hypothetical protein